MEHFDKDTQQSLNEMRDFWNWVKKELGEDGAQTRLAQYQLLIFQRQLLLPAFDAVDIAEVITDELFLKDEFTSKEKQIGLQMIVIAAMEITNPGLVTSV